MKRLLLSGGVIGLFLLYGWHQKQEAAELHVVPQQGNTNESTLSQQNPTSVPTDVPVQLQTSIQPTPTPVLVKGAYKDGTYTGSVADAFYGNIQVQASISGGKIANIQFLQYPNDRGTSIMINEQAMPYLKQEAIAAQSANVDIVSGATDSSQAFRQSLQSALDQAKI
jgi:uncharacterized protein with FMN-binding domain